MDYVTPKQLNYLLVKEPKIKKAKNLRKEDKAFYLDVIRRVNGFGIKTVLSKYEQERISRILKIV